MNNAGYLAFATAMCVTACGHAKEEARSTLQIVGGTRVVASDAIVKSTVALVSPDGRQFCTGSLVAPRYVVTAAHCLGELPWASFDVAFGPTAQSGSFSADRLRRATLTQMNEHFDPGQMEEERASAPPNDVGLVTLNEAAPADYAPIAMLARTDRLRLGETLTLAGFGVTSPTARTSGILHKVETDLTAIDSIAHEIHFGGHPGRSACMGDSGGPAFVTRDGRLALVGVTSRGSAQCDEDGIYTDVRYQRDWIERMFN